MSKKTKKPIKNKHLNRETPVSLKIKIKKILKCFGNAISIITSIIALILSGISYAFTKNISPLIYTYTVSEDVMVQVSSIKAESVQYNLSDVAIDINNRHGEVAEVFIASVIENKIDIYNCLNDELKITTLNGTMFKYTRSKSISQTHLRIGFSQISALESGYFFIIFKSYSGQYYYNLLHYIANDTSNSIDANGIVLSEVNITFHEIHEIYNRNSIQNLCDSINTKTYTKNQIGVDDYTKKIEEDYQAIKSKIEK